MSSIPPEIALRAALAAAESAASSLMADFERNGNGGGPELKSWMKSPGALVTEADLAADKAIANSLHGSGVEALLISEESTSGDGSGELAWLVDPLCGTVPFRAGMPHWGVNIALRQADRLVASVVSLPHSRSTLAAVAGAGVTLNGKPFDGKDPGLPLHEAVVGLETDGGEEWTRLFGTGPGGAAQITWPGSVSHVNTFASAAYPMSLVCTGGMSGVVFYTIDSVHLAAGALIAQELGVIVSDAYGNALDWQSDRPYSIAVIAWPSVHSLLIEAMNEV